MAIPYQPSYQIQNTHGFRYGAQPHADNVAPTYEIPAYEAPPKSVSDTTPQKNKTLDTAKSLVSNFEGNEDVDNSFKSAQMSLEEAQNQYVDDPYDPGIGGRPVYSPEFSLGTLMPFGIGSGPVSPTSGFGSPGSVNKLTGGVFDDKGREFDPILGRAGGFANAASFRSHMLNDPLGNILGDTDNKYNYSLDEKIDSKKGANQGYNFALDRNPQMGSMTNQDKVLRKLAYEDNLGPEHSIFKTRTNDGVWKDGKFVRDGSTTTLGTTKKGAHIKGQDLWKPKFGNIEGVEFAKDEAHGMAAKEGGSQAGVYNPDDSSPDLSGTTKSTAVATSKGSYADDAQASSSGGGGK